MDHMVVEEAVVVEAVVVLEMMGGSSGGGYAGSGDAFYRTSLAQTTDRPKLQCIDYTDSFFVFMHFNFICTGEWKDDLWIGGRKDDSPWMWEASNEEFSYANWGSPDQIYEDRNQCVIYDGGRFDWYVDECDGRYKSICEVHP